MQIDKYSLEIEPGLSRSIDIRQRTKLCHGATYTDHVYPSDSQTTSSLHTQTTPATHRSSDPSNLTLHTQRSRILPVQARRPSPDLHIIRARATKSPTWIALVQALIFIMISSAETSTSPIPPPKTGNAYDFDLPWATTAFPQPATRGGREQGLFNPDRPYLLGISSRPEQSPPDAVDSKI